MVAQWSKLNTKYYMELNRHVRIIGIHLLQNTSWLFFQVMLLVMGFFFIPGSLDLSQGNKEAQQTTSAICLLSWPQISLPPPSSALSPKWWSGETPSIQTAVANLRSFFVNVFFCQGSMVSFSLFPVGLFLFPFSSPCLAGLSWSFFGRVNLKDLV